MTEREDIVAAILSAAGGRMVGRVRLQKTAYLLERLGLGSKFGFDYHYYGPFSRDLDNAVADAKAFGLITERFEQRQSDGASYSIFTLEKPPASPHVGKLPGKRARELMTQIGLTDVTVLELAATIDWLWRAEKYPDWRSELFRRKRAKVRNGRLEKAVQLLQDLGLPPPPIPQA
jgi:uncharacterized protein YwgA